MHASRAEECLEASPGDSLRLMVNMGGGVTNVQIRVERLCILCPIYVYLVLRTVQKLGLLVCNAV